MLKIVARNIAASTELSVVSGSFGVEKVVQQDDSNASDSSGDSIVEGSAGGHVRGRRWGGARPAPSDNEGAVGVLAMVAVVVSVPVTAVVVVGGASCTKRRWA